MEISDINLSFMSSPYLKMVKNQGIAPAAGAMMTKTQQHQTSYNKGHNGLQNATGSSFQGLISDSMKMALLAAQEAHVK